MTRVGVISDELWAAVDALMPSDVGWRGHRFADHRLILEGIVWRFRTGAPWRDLSADFGPWQTVWKRDDWFSFDGTYQRIFDELRQHWADDELDEGMAGCCRSDSTVVRAHQHVVGAPAAEDTGAESNEKNSMIAEPDDQALGCFGDGLTIKIHCIDRDRDVPGR